MLKPNPSPLRWLVLSLALWASPTISEAGEVPKHIRLQRKCDLKDPNLCKHWFSCQSGKGASCFVVGTHWAKGSQKHKRDYKKAHVLFARGCQNKHGPSCTGLALLFAQGWGKPKQLDKARTYYHRACQLKHAISCSTLGLYYLKGVGGKKEWKEARFAFRRACDLGQGMGCHNVALFYTKKAANSNMSKAASTLARTTTNRTMKKQSPRDSSVIWKKLATTTIVWVAES